MSFVADYRNLSSCLLFTALLIGCAGGDDYETVTSEDADRAEAHVDEHHHSHEAPHGGHLIELGDHKYNAEVVLEAEPKQLVVFILDAHAENAVAIDAQTLSLSLDGAETISLEAQPQEGDANGQSSRFVAAGDAVEGIGDLDDLHGSITVPIRGTEYTGSLSHDHDHPGEEHNHDHGDGEDHEE